MTVSAAGSDLDRAAAATAAFVIAVRIDVDADIAAISTLIARSDRQVAGNADLSTAKDIDIDRVAADQLKINIGARCACDERGLCVTHFLR